MSWLETADVALFRWINQTVSNPVFDWVLPLFSTNRLFVPAVLLLAVGLLWQGGARGRVFVFSLALVLALGDAFVINLLKHAVGRARPFMELPDVRMLVGKGSSGSLPSSHTSTWFAATLMAFVFYRRSWRFMLPLAATVGLSRIYVGVHYPSDVLAGAVLGAGYAVVGLWLLNGLWQVVGSRWFPLWWRALPSLLDPAVRPAAGPPDAAERERHWVRLGYVLIGLVVGVRLVYIASGTIEVSKDEAYQWLWSKHLALSYFSKPPMIAYVQFLGTTLWGDNAFGIRFFSPVLGAILGVAILRFLAREVNAQAAVWLLLIVNATPLIALGTVLMTIDPLVVLFWTLAMIIGWRAIQPGATTKDWLLVGLMMGLGFLSKYNAALQIVCWAIFFALYPPARRQLRRPGPYLALLVFALGTLPVLIWNAQHGWITVEHVGANAGLGGQWKPTLRFVGDFLGLEFGLMNPVFFVGSLWAMAAFWQRRRQQPLLLYFFCMGAPVFLGHLAYAFRSRILPNWIAVAIIPMFCLMVMYWQMRWREGARWVKAWAIGGLVLGFFAVVIMHETRLLGRVVGSDLPPEMDPLRRVRAWKETANLVEAARQKLEAEGKPAFIIADHYGMTGLFTLYLPKAKAALADEPLVYCHTMEYPVNQFYFWPGYAGRRTGQNAIYVSELDPRRLESGWPWKWLTGQPIGLAASQRSVPFILPNVVAEFDSVTDLGVHEIFWRGKLMRRVRLYECRGLR